LAKRVPAFPNPQILEYYHTPEEIRGIKMIKEWNEYYLQRRVASAAVEKHTGKKFESLSPEEQEEAYTALGIDQQTECFFRDGNKGRGSKKRRARMGTNAGANRTMIL
jgi:hypothetical protein